MNMKQEQRFGTFGEWLSFYLQFHGITQKEMAFELCVAQQTVGSWIRNERCIGIRNLVYVCLTLEKHSEETYEELMIESTLLFK